MIIIMITYEKTSDIQQNNIENKNAILLCNKK